MTNDRIAIAEIVAVRHIMTEMSINYTDMISVSIKHCESVRDDIKL